MASTCGIGSWSIGVDFVVGGFCFSDSSEYTLSSMQANNVLLSEIKEGAYTSSSVAINKSVKSPLFHLLKMGSKITENKLLRSEINEHN